MVRRADPRGNPWARKKNWASRPTPLRTLRVHAGAEYERFRSPGVAAARNRMSERQYSPPMAAALARLVADAPWTRERLEEAFMPRPHRSMRHRSAG